MNTAPLTGNENNTQRLTGKGKMKNPTPELLQEAANLLNRSMSFGRWDSLGENGTTGNKFSWTSSQSIEDCYRLQEILGGHVYPKIKGHSDSWSLTRRADIEALVPILKPYMNEARQLEIEDEMGTWKNTPARSRGDRGISILKETGKPIAYTKKFISPWAM